MARWNSSLHPRDRNGKFTSKAGSNRSPARRKRPARRKSEVKRNFTRAVEVYQTYGDITDVASHGAKAAAYGATGNYVKSALHGAKASTATARLGSRATGALVKTGVVKPRGGAKKFYAAQAKFDDRVQSIDNIATIGLFVTGGSLRRKSKGSANGDYVKRMGGNANLKPAKRSRQGVHQITRVKRTTSGARVRR